MRKRSLMVLIMMIFAFAGSEVKAQCSICTKTAQQMGERPAKALNGGIIYLAFAPLAILGVIGYKWYKNQV